MSKSLRQTSLMLVSGTLLVLSLSACTFNDRDPAEARSAPLSAEEQAAMAPAEGLRLTPLFAEPVKNNKERFARLEDAVQTLRDDLDVYAPAMEERVEVLEEGMREVAARQQKIAEKTAVLVKEANKPVGDIKAVRIGDHMDKTRIVLDVTAQTEATSSLAKDGRQLVIDLPRLNWNAPKPEWKADGGALVSGWVYKDGKLYVDLVAPAVVKAQTVISGKSQHRLVIDLYAKGIHQ